MLRLFLESEQFQLVGCHLLPDSQSIFLNSQRDINWIFTEPVTQDAWIVDNGPEYGLSVVEVVNNFSELINGGSHFVEEHAALATTARTALLLGAEHVSVEVSAVLRVVQVPVTAKAIIIPSISAVLALNGLNQIRAATACAAQMRRNEGISIMSVTDVRVGVVDRAGGVEIILLPHEVEVDALTKSFLHRVVVDLQGRLNVVPVHGLELSEVPVHTILSVVVDVLSSTAGAAEVLSLKVTGVIPTAVLGELVIQVAPSTECVKDWQSSEHIVLVDAGIDLFSLGSELADTAELVSEEAISVVEATGIRVVLIPCTSVACAVQLGRIGV